MPSELSLTGRGMAWRSQYCYKDVLPFLAMVAVECTDVGQNTLFKAATSKGMSYHVFIVYSYAMAGLVLLPLIFIFPSTAVLPSSKLPLLFRICILGLIGFLSQLFGYQGLNYSSPTLSSAMSNVVPAFTFILAVVFRMERLDLRRCSTQDKIIGTVVSISGALVVVLYKGPILISTSSATQSVPLQQTIGSSNWIVGGLLLAAHYLLYSIWYIILTDVMKIFPAELNVVFLFKFCATIISAPVCLMLEPNLSAWGLGSEIAVISVIYSGILGTAFSTVVNTWGLHLKGPVYIATFRPLSIAIAVIMSFIFLGDALYLGSVVGAIIISPGFYAVIWGKANEEDTVEGHGYSSLASSSDGKSPFLPRENTARS